jgi:hypothetical protein
LDYVILYINPLADAVATATKAVTPVIVIKEKNERTLGREI